MGAENSVHDSVATIRGPRYRSAFQARRSDVTPLYVNFTVPARNRSGSWPAAVHFSNAVRIRDGGLSRHPTAPVAGRLLDLAYVNLNRVLAVPNIHAVTVAPCNSVSHGVTGPALGRLHRLRPRLDRRPRYLNRLFERKCWARATVRSSWLILVGLVSVRSDGRATEILRVPRAFSMHILLIWLSFYQTPPRRLVYDSSSDRRANSRVISPYHQ
jgi:hypothetical protein